MKTIIITLISILTLNANAALLKTEAHTSKLENVALSSTASTNIDGEDVKLTHVGAGLRAKKVVFVNVKVYVGELFTSDPTKFKKSDALTSVKDQKAIAVQLHFLRDVDAENVQKSFKEALTANSVNIEDASIKQFLDAVNKGGEAKQGKSLTILGSRLKDGSEKISYETTSGTVTEVKGSAGLVEKVFSIWLGKPSDNGVADLKKSILKD
ncbi:chalcone isomerase family protein [Bdellovibrio sp. SKB1291214]|uniref:chalcone isomerase family protein n=1 Tax=Bdellovibrio sp. SKB1291214 TaxID=1732569 RepID=UPI000B517282|nr:chalcone isomerase family protein [Bdellovibrio sp. SKB1291214]UYL08182.1 chalcone isomerase family protein [Bdellovibrio sp. SKB1291214]